MIFMIRLSFAAIGVFLIAGTATAQVTPPFFFGGATAFEPQIGIVNSGVVQDVQAIVSHDMKYVTLNMQPQNAGLLALQEFTFQKQPSLGVVGLPGTIAPAPRAPRARADTWEPVKTSAAEVRRQADSWVLEREGMFRIADAN
jgi:hypothetical protein